MVIGRYYEQRAMYISAIGRFRDVAENFQTTAQTPEALLRLVECYKALGLDEEAKRTAAVLGYNYSGSSWYKDAYRLVADQNYHGPAKTDPDEPGWFDWLF